jgi:hypothetical protein
MSKKPNKQKQSRFNFSNHFDSEINKKISPVIVETAHIVEPEKIQETVADLKPEITENQNSTQPVEIKNNPKPELIKSEAEKVEANNIDDKLIKEKLVLTGVYFTKSVKSDLQERAKELEMSVSNMIEIVMLSYLKGDDVTKLISSEIRQAGRPFANRKTEV